MNLMKGGDGNAGTPQFLFDGSAGEDGYHNPNLAACPLNRN